MCFDAVLKSRLILGWRQRALPYPARPSPLAGPAETLVPALPAAKTHAFPFPKAATRAAAGCYRGSGTARRSARLSAPGQRRAAAGLSPPQLPGRRPRPRPRSRPAGAGLGALRRPSLPRARPCPAPALPPLASPRRRPRPPHLLLQQREGRARIDPQVLGGGLPVVSQVGGPVPHHEEVQELRGRGGGERRVRDRGAAPAGRRRPPGPGPAAAPRREPSRQPLHLPISLFNAFSPVQVRPSEGMLRASGFGVSGACFTVGSKKGILVPVAERSQ